MQSADVLIGYNVFRLRKGKEPIQTFTGLAAGLIRYAALLSCLPATG